MSVKISRGALWIALTAVPAVVLALPLAADGEDELDKEDSAAAAWEVLSADLAGFDTLRARVSLLSPLGGTRRIESVLYADRDGRVSIDPIGHPDLRFHIDPTDGFGATRGDEELGLSEAGLIADAVGDVWTALGSGQGKLLEDRPTALPPAMRAAGMYWASVDLPSADLTALLAFNDAGLTHVVVGPEWIPVSQLVYDEPLPGAALERHRWDDPADPLFGWWRDGDGLRCGHSH